MIADGTVKVRVPLNKIVDSRFRDFKLNPLKVQALEALEESYESTGYWGNAVLRKLPDGTYEIIAGHHRVKLLKKKNKKDLSVDYEFLVGDFSDAEVQKRMSRDHHPAFNHNFKDLIERVRAAVNSYAAGGISEEEMPRPDASTPKVHLRYAPSFVAGRTPSTESVERPYTVSTLAKFLGRIKPNGQNGLDPSEDVEVAITYLECCELGLWKEEHIELFERDNQISIASVQKAAKAVQLRKERVLIVGAEKAAAVIEAAKPIQQRCEEYKALVKATKEECERLAKIGAEELSKKKAEQLAIDKAEALEKAKRAAELAEEARKEWDANAAERERDKKAEERRKEREVTTAEAQRASRVKRIINLIEVRFQNEDALYDEIKSLWKSSTTTTTVGERERYNKALEGVADRALALRVKS